MCSVCNQAALSKAFQVANPDSIAFPDPLHSLLHSMTCPRGLASVLFSFGSAGYILNVAGTSVYYTKRQGRWVEEMNM